MPSLQETFEQSLRAFLVPPPAPGNPVYEQLRLSWFADAIVAANLNKIAMTPELSEYMRAMKATN